MTQDGTETVHEWRQVSFSWGSWIECSCGFRPESQEQMDEHITPEPVMEEVTDATKAYHLGRADVYKELAEQYNNEWMLYGKSNDLTMADLYQEKASIEREAAN